jgi:hypothetical protein
MDLKGLARSGGYPFAIDIADVLLKEGGISELRPTSAVIPVQRRDHGSEASHRTLGAMVDASRAEGWTWRIIGMDIGRALRLEANCNLDDAVRDAEKSVFCKEVMVAPRLSGKPRNNARGIRRCGGAAPNCILPLVH